ncbi:MAG: hypothetical protein JEZ11_17870 [Desulfobacterales bacterium]|nr:hypothetical protein [Desulfobacterales bacterium]
MPKLHKTLKEHCFYCRKKLGLLEDFFLVKKASKPKGVPYRWKPIGVACVKCVGTFSLSFEEPPGAPVIEVIQYDKEIPYERIPARFQHHNVTVDGITVGFGSLEECNRLAADLRKDHNVARYIVGTIKDK